MVGVLVPINITGNLLVKMLVWMVEKIFFFQKKALYYLVGTKVTKQIWAYMLQYPYSIRWAFNIRIASEWCRIVELLGQLTLLGNSSMHVCQASLVSALAESSINEANTH